MGTQRKLTKNVKKTAANVSKKVPHPKRNKKLGQKRKQKKMKAPKKNAKKNKKKKSTKKNAPAKKKNLRKEPTAAKNPLLRKITKRVIKDPMVNNLPRKLKLLKLRSIKLLLKRKILNKHNHLE